MMAQVYSNLEGLKMTSKVSDKIFIIISYFTLGVFALLCLYPLVLTLSVSFSDENTVLLKGFKLIPEKFSSIAYQYIWDKSGDKILNSYVITLFITIIGTLFSMLVTSMLAYAMSQKYVKYRNAISLYSYFTVIFSAGIVPWYIICVNVLHIQNTFFALFIPYSVNVWYLFLMKNFFQSIPPAIIESVKIDGAGEFLIFFKIAIPLSKTAVLTVALFYALQFWNDWWLPIMLVSNSKLFTLQYYLYSMLTNVQALSNSASQGAASSIKLPTETVKMALTIITIGPVIFLYPFIQKYFVRGIVIGAVKG